MNTKLITALRTSAKALEDGTFEYDWSMAEACNCGVLACCILGKSQSELEAALPDDITTWESFVGKHCPITGVPNNEVLKILLSYGMSPLDLVHLENLSNPEVLKRLPKKIETQERTAWESKAVQPKPNFWKKLFNVPEVPKIERVAVRTNVSVETSYNRSDREDVIAYMRAWADILTEKGKLDQPTGQTAEAVINNPTEGKE